jgi:transposase InsO family protein
MNKKPGTKKNRRKTSSSIEDLIIKLRLDTPFGPLRIAYAKLYRRKSALNSLSFLKELYLLFEFKIKSILTDNGLEFTNIRGNQGSSIMDEFCLRNNIKHKLTRKRRPQTNGKVERFHRTVGEEFYNRNFYLSLEDMNKGLKSILNTIINLDLIWA